LDASTLNNAAILMTPDFTVQRWPRTSQLRNGPNGLLRGGDRFALV
jgi:hypothetical protein